MTAVGYIRQSKRADLDTALSFDTQLIAIRKMAGGDVDVLSDMGRSGKRGGEHLRPNYQRLMELVRDRQVDTVYVISLSRLSRSVPELHAFMTLCQSVACAIVSDKEGRLDPSTATGKLTFNLFASFAEYVRDLQVEAANDNIRERRARGDKLGRIPYGERPGDQPDKVLEAWAATRSLSGTARRLNRDGVPAWGGGIWRATDVRRTITRLDPTALPVIAPSRGVKPVGRFRLYRLLRCHCGTVMTGKTDRRRGHEAVEYRCHRAATDPNHKKPYRVTEFEAVPWVIAQAERWNPPADTYTMEESAAAIGALEEKRAALGVAFSVGAFGTPDTAVAKATLRAKVAEVDAEIAAIPSSAVTVELERIDWRKASPGTVNDVLRSLFEAVILDENLRPVDVVRQPIAGTWS